MTGATVLAIKYKDGVMMSSDTLGAECLRPFVATVVWNASRSV